MPHRTARSTDPRVAVAPPKPASASPKAVAAKAVAPAKAQAALLQPRPMPSPSVSARLAAIGIPIGTGVSVLVHLFVLVGLGFAMPDGGARKEKPHLDVVLVNAKHSKAPREAQALAQANMDGGGTVEQKDMPTTPLPPEVTDQAGDAMMDASKRVQSLEARQRALLEQAKALAAVEQATGRRSNEQTATESPQKGESPEEKTRAMAKQEAVVDRMLRQYAQRPRKTVISPRTKESGFALYTVAWRKVVEDLGSLKFPKGDDGRAIYGSVMLSIEIDRKGKLVDVSVERSSGNKKLDQAAMRIVQMASPFKPLPPETAKDTDILVLVETFRFQKIQGDSSLELKSGAN